MIFLLLKPCVTSTDQDMSLKMSFEAPEEKGKLSR